jgi:hypothetical protein
MTTGQNPSARTFFSLFPHSVDVTTDQTINLGDLVYWDGVNGTLKPLTASTSVAVAGTAPYYTAGFCGVAAGSNDPNIYPAEPSNASSEYLPGLKVIRAGSVWLYCTAGEFYNNFTPVTVGATAQTVTLVGATAANRVGFVLTPTPTSPSGAAGGTPTPELLAGTGQRVEVWLEAKFPNIGVF